MPDIARGQRTAREGGRHVLLVEDDEILAEVVTGAARAPSPTSAGPTAPKRALELLPERRWDLIVADIELPEANGIEFIGNAKSADPNLSTLIVSGRSSFDYAIGAIRAGADDYMTKPLEPEALIAKAEELMKATTRRRAEGHAARPRDRRPPRRRRDRRRRHPPAPRATPATTSRS